MDTNQVLEEILENSFEIGIVGSKINNDKLRFESLLEDKMVLITPNNEKFNKFQNDSISLEDLKNEKFIFRESGSGTRKEFEKKLIKAGKDPKSINIIAQINSAEAIKQAVSLGVGISIASYISVKDYIKFGLIKAFEIKELDLKREFYLVYHKNRPMSPLVNVFKEFAMNYYNKNSSSSV